MKTLLEIFEDMSNEKIIHVTSPDVGEKIKTEGFKAIKNDIDYKYYSEFGSKGIYFYNNIRLVQQYAYFLKDKLKLNSVYLIYCEAPINIIQYNDKKEDGLFINTENLALIKIINIKNINRIGELY